MRSRAFTIVETLFAVLLISLIGMAILKSYSNNTKMINYSLKREKFIYLCSIFVNNMQEGFSNTKKTLYDLIEKKYKLDDETRRALKEKKYLLQSEYIDTIYLKDKNDTQEAKNNFDIDYSKESISGKYNFFIYSIKLQ